LCENKPDQLYGDLGLRCAPAPDRCALAGIMIETLGGVDAEAGFDLERASVSDRLANALLALDQGDSDRLAMNRWL
jgi:hypothetical protein